MGAMVTTSESEDSMVLNLERGWSLDELSSGRPLPTVASGLRIATENRSPGKSVKASSAHVQAGRTKTAGQGMQSTYGKSPDPLMDELFHRLATQSRVNKERTLQGRATSRTRAHTSMGFGREEELRGDGLGMSRLNAAVPRLDLRKIR